MKGGMYTREDYDRQQQGSLAAARVIVPYVLRITKARSVVDIGCGVGTWLRAFEENGISDYVGLDGHHVNADRMHIPPDRFRPVDLTGVFRLDRTFDLTCSLEVAEHLPSQSAQRFIELLTTLAPAILFSAAIPGQD